MATAVPQAGERGTPRHRGVALRSAADPAKIDAIVRMLASFEILELVRTGRIVLVRGPKQT